MAIKEDVDCDPWTSIARYKLRVENDLQSIPDLNYVILRPALVYGVGDKAGLSRSKHHITYAYASVPVQLSLLLL